MRIELDQAHFADHGYGIFEIGCILQNDLCKVVKIVDFSGYSEIDEEEGTEHETIIIHFDDGSTIDHDDLRRAIFNTETYLPISPDWFVDEVFGDEETRKANAEAEKAEAARQAEEDQKRDLLRMHVTLSVHAKTAVEDYTDQALMAKVSGAPLQVCEDVLMAYDCSLMKLARFSSRNMEKVKGIGKARAEKIAAALELGKRLARSHAEKDKITSPSDVADLMMSKLRYLQKEIVVVLCLDTKGGITTQGKMGVGADALNWGKLIAEKTIFEGTLNASVFHPREIFKFAIEESANSVVLVHNHPSGDPQPSQEDIRATKQLIEAGNVIGIKVLDHVVVGDGIFVSLKEEGFI